MAKRNRKRKLRSIKARHGRSINYCGAPCDLQEGTICEDCKEYRPMRHRGTDALEGGDET